MRTHSPNCPLAVAATQGFWIESFRSGDGHSSEPNSVFSLPFCLEDWHESQS